MVFPCISCIVIVIWSTGYSIRHKPDENYNCVSIKFGVRVCVLERGCMVFPLYLCIMGC